MLNERFLGVITSVSAGVKTVKLPDGAKIKQGVFKVKLESADIDYKVMNEFNPNISATLLNIQPMPMKGVDFGEQLVNNLMASFYTEDEGQLDMITDDVLDGAEADCIDIDITNLNVKIKENIPTYIFSLEIPMSNNGTFLFLNLKKKISFEFADMVKKEIRNEE